MALKKKFDDEYQELSAKANGVQARMIRLKKSFSGGNAWLQSVGLLEGQPEITPELVAALIERMLVYQNESGDIRLEIQYKYGEDMALLQSAYDALKGGNQR